MGSQGATPGFIFVRTARCTCATRRKLKNGPLDRWTLFFFQVFVFLRAVFGYGIEIFFLMFFVEAILVDALRTIKISFLCCICFAVLPMSFLTFRCEYCYVMYIICLCRHAKILEKTQDSLSTIFWISCSGIYCSSKNIEIDSGRCL